MSGVWAIVLMYGEEALTAGCIASLLEQDYRELTVLLVDNASPDGSGERVRGRFPSIHYINTGANLGYAGGNNRGIEHAIRQGAEFVFVLNNDTTLDADCVSRLVESARGLERVGAVAPKILYFEDPRRIWYAGGDFSTLRAAGDHRRDLDFDTPDEPGRLDRITFATGCAFLMPATVARELAGFAEDLFMYCEDTDLSLRALQAGYELYYQPAARVYHHKPLVSTISPFQIRMRDRNRRRLVRRHYRLADRVRFAAWFYPTRLIRLLEYSMRGDWSRARAIVAGATEQ